MTQHYIEVWDAKARAWVRLSEAYVTSTAAGRHIQRTGLVGARVVRDRLTPHEAADAARSAG